MEFPQGENFRTTFYSYVDDCIDTGAHEDNNNTVMYHGDLQHIGKNTS